MAQDWPPKRHGSVRPDRIDPDEMILVSLPQQRNVTVKQPWFTRLVQKIRSVLGRSFPATGRSTKEKPK